MRWAVAMPSHAALVEWPGPAGGVVTHVYAFAGKLAGRLGSDREEDVDAKGVGPHCDEKRYQEHGIQHLGQEQDRHQRKAGDQDDRRAEAEDGEVAQVEEGCLGERIVELALAS
jgi:hypothetical protein